MTGDEIVDDILAYVRRVTDGNDDPFVRGYAIGQISISVGHLGATPARAEAAMEEIKRLTRAPRKPRFAMTYCSQCGQETGPGDQGFSHCSDHSEAA